MERAGYAILAILAVGWLIAIIVGLVAALPVGGIGLLALLGIGLLFTKVVKDRIENEEDSYYSKHVDK